MICGRLLALVLCCNVACASGISGRGGGLRLAADASSPPGDVAAAPSHGPGTGFRAAMMQRATLADAPSWAVWAGMLGCLVVGAGIGGAGAYAYGLSSGLEEESQVVEEKSGPEPAATVIDSSEPSAQWLNGLVVALWPRIDAYISTMVTEKIAPSIDAALPSILKGAVKFGQVTIGKVAPQFGPLRTRKREEGTIVIDVGLNMSSDIDIQIIAAKVPIGIKEISFNGTFSIVMRPAAVKPPFFGGIEVYFVNTPDVDLKFTGAASVGDIGGIHGIIRDAIIDVLRKQIVLPARIAIDASPDDDVDITDIRCPDPLGMVVLTLASGSGLRADDVSLFSRAKTSDPYVVMEVGNQTWRSPTQKKTVDPVWTKDNVKEMFVYEMGQDVAFAVYDEDFAGGDDLLGRSRVPAEKLILSHEMDVPLMYKGAKAGSLSVSASWLGLTRAQPTGVASASTRLLLVAKILDVMGLPPTSQPPYTVRLRVSGIPGTEPQEVCSKVSKAPKQATAAPLAQHMAAICGALAEVRGPKAMTIDEIAKVVQLDPEQVKSAIADRSASTDLAATMRERAATCPDFGEVLCLPLPWLGLAEPSEGIAGVAVVSLEIQDRHGRQVGFPLEVRLSELTSSATGEVAGPFKVSETARLRGSLRARWLVPS
mmetsp:Transcript_46837/g.102392  ORF Transcript_46837/g.102392 Transcript_46837/m.102392 type:complete len:653 (+) Transcript_46837:3-1961(+)